MAEFDTTSGSVSSTAQKLVDFANFSRTVLIDVTSGSMKVGFTSSTVVLTLNTAAVQPIEIPLPQDEELWGVGDTSATYTMMVTCR